MRASRRSSFTVGIVGAVLKPLDVFVHVPGNGPSGYCGEASLVLLPRYVSFDSCGFEELGALTGDVNHLGCLLGFPFLQSSLLSRETYISAMMFLSLAFVGFDTQLAVMRFFISGMSFDAAQIHLEFS